MEFHQSGLQYASYLLTGSVSDPINYFAWGAGSNAFSFTDSTLGSELFPSGTATQRNAVYSLIEKPGQVIFTGRIESDQLIGGSIYEVGLATAISGNIISIRNVSAKRLKTATLEFINDWYLTVKDV